MYVYMSRAVTDTKIDYVVACFFSAALKLSGKKIRANPPGVLFAMFGVDGGLHSASLHHMNAGCHPAATIVSDNFRGLYQS